MNSIQEEHPDFKLAFGNEIYLVDERKPGQQYYHFILIAKDAIGHRALRELSSHAWVQSYVDRRLERVPTTKDELAEIATRYKGHLIATTACIGGELAQSCLMYSKARLVNDLENAKYYYAQIEKFIQYCLDLFGEDFYIECAPGLSADQHSANRVCRNIASYYKIKLTTATDAHYLTKEDRPIHKAYLNSKDGDREVDMFYEYTYLMDYDECLKILSETFDNDIEFTKEVLNNTLEIYNKIERYSLFHKQQIPLVPVKDYPKSAWWSVNNDYADEMERFPTLKKLFVSDDIQDRYWVNECWNKLNEIGKGWDQYLEPGADSRYLVELEEEARVKSVIGEKLETNMFQYPNTLQHYIDLIWDSGSTVGAGRGSSCAALNHELLGVTQLDPIQWQLPFFRYLNDERVELGDIDIDICPSKCGTVLAKIAAERSQMFNDDVADWAKKLLGCTRIATFGTEGTKSAILTACRGYRSEEYPYGIDVDEAQYMASLVPQERGFLWPIKDVVRGNPDKGRNPSQTFIYEVNQYPGLLDIIIGIEGIINKRSSHASGIVLFENDPFEKCAFMRTPKGEIITQWNLHDVEYMGSTKYDFLVTEAQDKIVQTIKFLQEDGEIEPELSLREVYDKYLHPSVLPLDDERMWDALDNNEVLNVFQFDSIEGSKAARQLRPRSILEMADANGLIRLMGEEGQERPIDKYARYKNDISLWYDEMSNFGLTAAEQKTLEPYFKPSYGVPPSQEQLMKMLMDENICGFTLAEANAARKIVGKKQMSKIPALREQVLTRAKSEKLGQYVWRYGAGPQMGYSFSVIHALAYSFIGAQTLYLATRWDPIYWDTACLVVNSGSLEDAVDEEGLSLYDEEESETDDKKKKTVSTDYGKTAKAVNEIIKAGIKVSLIDINKSDFGFKPDVQNHQILFGMKALLNVNDDLVRQIIENRPYANIKDFYYKIKPKKPAMVSLIKAGAFDNMMDRKTAMAWFIWETCDKKSRLTLQNFSTLAKQDLVPLDTEERKLAYKVYEFNRYLKSVCKNKSDAINYHVDNRAIEFLINLGAENLIQDNLVNMKSWDRIYQAQMDIFRDWLRQDGAAVLEELNARIFKADWDKYAGKANLSAWEMEVLCFYYHEHELAHINKTKYGLSDWDDIPESPQVERTYFKGSRMYNIFKLYKIYGTCIAKNKIKSMVSLLTPQGVVDVKLRKEHFALFDKQISEMGDDGVKHVVERSWFNRGNMLIVQGIRSEESFIAKKYAHTDEHQLYKIVEIDNNGDIVLQGERYGGAT